MKLKLDLHPIFNDTGKIESALQSIIDDAVTKRAAEVEIIPGKGSGALKKTVIRFLERPDIKVKYHRMEKDGDNWGRLFVHFRHEKQTSEGKAKPVEVVMVTAACACCGQEISVPEPESDLVTSIPTDCSWCASPNLLTLRRDRRGMIYARTELNYPSE
jgi:hypothetical protein